MDAAGHPSVIPGDDGDRLVRALVTLTQKGEVVVGNRARAALIDRADRTVTPSAADGPRRGGCSGELKLFPFRVAEGSESVIRIQLGERTFTPPEISAFILRQLKKNAEAFLARPSRRPSSPCPPISTTRSGKRRKTPDALPASKCSGLVNEPTAAALAYGLDKRREGSRRRLRSGGGTFDISILKLHDGIFEVLATNGDTHLGGDDIDNRLIHIAVEDIQSEWGNDISHDGEAVQTLRRAVIEAKERLSFVPATNIELNYKGRHYQREITRELFEKLIADIVDRTLGPCRACIKDAGVTLAGVTESQIDEVVLVGGSTRIPMVRSAVETLFRAKPHTDLIR